MSILSLFLFVVGISAASSFITSPSEDIALQDADRPGYYEKAELIVRENGWEPKGSLLDGIDAEVYDRAKPAIQDFARAVLTNEIEITAECFFSLLVNWLIANEKSFTRPDLQTHVVHQMYLESSSIKWGTPDLVIESTSPTGVRYATIFELKFFNRLWSDDWETQLCSYLLGYYDKDKTHIQAHGVISNMVTTNHYNCKLVFDSDECHCQKSVDYYLFNEAVGTLPPNKGYMNFDHASFLHFYAGVLKNLHTLSPPNF